MEQSLTPDDTTGLPTPLVSIVMPCFRMGHFLPKSLASIDEQTYTNWELLVVDDCGPEDGTAKTVASFAERFDSGKVVYLRNEENQGVSKSRNVAIGRAAGQLVAFLDADDYWHPKFLATCVARFLSDPGLGVVASAVQVVDPANGTSTEHVMGTNSFERLHFPLSLSIGNLIQPSAAMVRAESVRAVGGFTVVAELQHVEDWDLWIRLVQSGVSFGFIDEALSYYRRHPGSATASDEKTSRLIANLIEHHRAWFDVSRLRYMKALGCEIDLLRQQTARLERPSIRLILKLDQWISSLLKPFSRANR
jgi:glycosyltransferase involved in cell wall biosynthesis